MLRPVKLNASGDPRSGKPYESRFDHMIIIHKIIIIRLVISSLNPSAQLRENHDFQIFIFQINCMPHLILFLMAYLFCRRIGIKLP